ncbi:MAG TPA: di-heme oxidoredictase family protein [Terriglobales bacterium]|nr:di-heme oxidoredictase family protein [Terriglobales bacterium]
MPLTFGSSQLTVERAGHWANGRYVPAAEDGVLHRHGGLGQQSSLKTVIGERVSINLLGNGFIEAIADEDLRRNAAEQRASKDGIAGNLVYAPVLESISTHSETRVGRFGWKSQHSSLMSACADSLRNELGIRNRLYPDEYLNYMSTATQSPIDFVDPKTGATQLERVVGDVRQTLPPSRDRDLAATTDALSGEIVFQRIGRRVSYCNL